MMSSSDKKKNTGLIFIGFAVLMFGMETMSGAVEGLRENEAFTNILTMFSNPIMGILVGTIFTAIIQSSSASVGILQALALSCVIPHSTALPVLLGMNIGTTITPVISSLSGNTESKQVAISCVYIKMIGVVIVTAAFYLVYYLTDLIDPFMNSQATVFTIAISHTLFNIISTIILMPFCSAIEKLAIKTFKPNPAAQKSDVFDTLDERFLDVPAFAVEKCRELVCDMAKISSGALNDANNLFADYSDEKFSEVMETEELVDKYEDKTSTYLVKVAAADISTKDSKIVTELLHCIGDGKAPVGGTVN